MSTDRAERPRFAKRSEVETWSREASNIRPFCRKLAKMQNVRQLHSARCRRLTWSTVERHERQPCNAGCRYITLHNIESGQATRSTTTQRRISPRNVERGRSARSEGYRRATWGVVEGREARPRGARYESAEEGQALTSNGIHSVLYRKSPRTLFGSCVPIVEGR